MMAQRPYGICGCKRKIAPQHVHNDPHIWSCLACSGAVCDYCYHSHYQKHLPPAPTLVALDEQEKPDDARDA